MLLRYSAVIRAYKYNDTLVGLIEDLRNQTIPPESIIIVDSSYDDDVNFKFRETGAVTVKYGDSEFNYSRAINIGVSRSASEFTLIISSHIRLGNKNIIQKGWDCARKFDSFVVSWSSCSEQVEEKIHLVSRKSFNGRNGISNSMSLLPTGMIKGRPFLEEMISAEDQEWSRYYINEHDGVIVKITTSLVSYENPNHGHKSWSIEKIIKEDICLGHFVDRSIISPKNILLRIARGIFAISRLRFKNARGHFRVARDMICANFTPPKGSSRYF